MEDQSSSLRSGRIFGCVRLNFKDRRRKWKISSQADPPATLRRASVSIMNMGLSPIEIGFVTVCAEASSATLTLCFASCSALKLDPQSGPLPLVQAPARTTETTCKGAILPTLLHDALTKTDQSRQIHGLCVCVR